MRLKVSVNTSFGAEDDLQLLRIQMVAEGSRYETVSFCVADRAYSIAIHNHGSLIIHKLSNALNRLA